MHLLYYKSAFHHCQSFKKARLIFRLTWKNGKYLPWRILSLHDKIGEERQHFFIWLDMPHKTGTPSRMKISITPPSP